MKTIGLLGGMSWESTAEYYRIINERVKRQLGGLHSAKIALYSVDFFEIEALQHQGNWEEAAAMMIAGAQRVAAAGSDCLLICTNTMHKMADSVAAAIDIPLLHIADATAARVKAEKVQRVGLLGTRFTMEQDFYCGRLRERHGLDVVVPDEDERAVVHEVIYDELCKGLIRDESRAGFLRIVNRLAEQGCQGIILGCTEIGLLIGQKDCNVPVYDTTVIHAEAAVNFALHAGS